MKSVNYGTWFSRNTFKGRSAPLFPEANVKTIKWLFIIELETWGVVRLRINKCLLRGITTTIRSLTEIVSGWNPNIDKMQFHLKTEISKHSIFTKYWQKIWHTICTLKDRNQFMEKSLGSVSLTKENQFSLMLTFCFEKYKQHTKYIHAVSSNHPRSNYFFMTKCIIIRDSQNHFPFLKPVYVAYNTNFIKCNLNASQVRHFLCTSNNPNPLSSMKTY